MFLYDTQSHGNTPPYQVYLKTVELFRRYRPDKIGHTNRLNDGHSDSNIPPPLPGRLGWGEGGIKKKKEQKRKRQEETKHMSKYNSHVSCFDGHFSMTAKQ